MKSCFFKRNPDEIAKRWKHQVFGNSPKLMEPRIQVVLEAKTPYHYHNVLKEARIISNLKKTHHPTKTSLDPAWTDNLWEDGFIEFVNQHPKALLSHPLCWFIAPRKNWTALTGSILGFVLLIPAFLGPTLTLFLALGGIERGFGLSLRGGLYFLGGALHCFRTNCLKFGGQISGSNLIFIIGIMILSWNYGLCCLCFFSRPGLGSCSTSPTPTLSPRPRPLDFLVSTFSGSS